jgi:hypothetical protein
MNLTKTQRKALFDIIPKTFDIGDVEFTATCLYENQFEPGGRAIYPAIILKYVDSEEIDVLDMGETIFKTATLNINVYAREIDERATGGSYLNGKLAVDGMTNDILDALNDNYDLLIHYGIILNERIKGVKVRDLSTIATVKHVYRNYFQIELLYEVN